MRHASLSRRHFLRAAGGMALALPLLQSLGARAQETVFPKRLILIYNPNGSVPDAWAPTNIVAEDDFQLGEIHAPLEPFKSRLLIPRGINLAVAALGPGGPHQRGIGSLFTGRELQEGTFLDGCGAAAGWASGISVDQEAAGVIGATTAFKSLELGIRASSADVQGRISYAGAGRPLPPLNDPRETFARLFNNFTPDDTGEPDLRRSVLDAVQGQFGQLHQRLGSNDRVKLEEHLELVRDLERRLGVGTGGGAACRLPEAPPALDPDNENDMPAITKLQLDLMAMAIACDLVRVGSIQFSTAFNRIRFPWLDSLVEGHSLSHTGVSDVSARAQLVARARWHAEQVAYLVERLSLIPEGPGSALDNTLILWGNEVSVGSTHSHVDMPFLLIGSAGGYFRTGRTIDTAGAAHNQLLVSVLNAVGVETTCFGHADYCAGPLPGLV